MTAKYRLDWAGNHRDVIIETEAGSVRLTLDEFLDMAEHQG